MKSRKDREELRRTPFAADFLNAYQNGVLKYTYKGVPCLKSPIDLGIYLQALWVEKPKTILEIGSKSGGSAMFFSDVAASFKLGASIVSIDIHKPSDPPDCDVRFLEGDVRNLSSVFDENDLYSLPRPWFVIEDSSHTYEGCTSALEFFRGHLRSGEMLVIEDGILSDLGLAEKYDGGPTRAIADFFAKWPTDFEVATEYTGMFGPNVTYNPDGYLRRL